MVLKRFIQDLYNKQARLEWNIWKFAVHKTTNKRTYMTFMTIFLLTMPNTTARTIGFLTLVGQITGVLFEVPSGYISDRIGHKQALILGRAALAVSTFLYIVADRAWYFFLATIFLSIGWAFESGTDSAFMHETLRSLGKQDLYARIMGKIKSLGFAVPVILILILAAVADHTFRTAFVIAFCVDLVGLVAVLLLATPPIEQSTGELTFEKFSDIEQSFMRVGWMPYIVASTLLSGILLGTTIGFKNPYQEMLGLSITLIGVFWAISRLLISGMLLLNGKIYERFSFKQFILFEALIVGVSVLGIGLTRNMWVVAALFVFANVPLWGLGGAREQYYLSFIHDKNSKATLLSLIELINKIVIGIVGFFMGFLVLDVGFENAYLVVGAALILLAVGTALFVHNHYIIRSQ